MLVPSVQRLPSRETSSLKLIIYGQVLRGRYNARRLRATAPEASHKGPSSRRPRVHLHDAAASARASSQERRSAKKVYVPNFCGDCGERVERARWMPWTDRRFCARCSPRFRRRRVASNALMLAILLSCGFLFGRASRPSPPLVVERGEMTLATVPPARTARSDEPAEKNEPGARKAENSYGPDGTASERPTDPDEVVSICGARTKKGTACQRRVRGTGRCWQHRGKGAILPPSKLSVPE